MDTSMDITADHEGYGGVHDHENTAAESFATEAAGGHQSEGESKRPPEVRPDHGRCILHFDIDSFYAQVEEVLDPRLKGKPIGIRQKYLLVTCNYTARRMGARKMESVAEARVALSAALLRGAAFQAKKRCPSLVVMDGEDLTRYREASEAIFSYVSRVCGPLVQRLGMDEIFADVTNYIRGQGSVADMLCDNGDTTEIASQPPGKEKDGAGNIFTGHVYTPGSGGRLLEAQTGLEISLGSGAGDGSVRSRRESGKYRQEGHGTVNRDRAGGVSWDSASNSSCTPEDLVPGAPLAAAKSSLSQQGRSNGPSAAGVTPAGGSGGDCAGKCRCGCIERLARASAFAERVRRGLRIEVGYTCSAGIGCSKAAAKLAGELHKPDQQTTILPEHTASMITQLPLRKLPGCGYSTCAKIKTELGITETRQMQKAPWPLLLKAVGHKLAVVLYLLCRGEDPTPVMPSVRPKTMSDEDSFKRGSVRSREQVERHIRRLAAPLLLRAGERVRSHKESPETLRLGVRRASKGYGHRVTRQCAISSGFAAAWGLVGEDVAAAAAAEAGGLPASWKAMGAAEAVATGARIYEELRRDDLVQTSDPELLDVPNNSEHRLVDGAQDSSGGHTQSQSQKSISDTSASHGGPVEESSLRNCDRLTGEKRKSVTLSAASEASRSQHGDRALDALSEVVRLAMIMFDKIVPPGENMDITLLSVGLASFSPLRGSAQTGIARFLNTQPPTPAGQARCVARRFDGGVGPANTSPHGSPASLPSQGLSMIHTQRLLRHSSPPASQSLAASVSDGGRLGIDDAIPQTEVSSVTGTAIARRGSETETQPSRNGAERDWEEAEVLVVAVGGQTVEGRGRLDWCSTCSAHVLRDDLEEHLSSEFHRTR